MISRSFGLLLLVIALFTFQSCQDQILQPTNELKKESSVDTKKVSKITNADLKTLAKDLALLLNNDNIREFLGANIRGSKYVEQILEASEFLNEEMVSKTTIYQELLKLDKENEFISSCNNLDFGLVDIYFPIDEQRETWNKNKELLIAPVDQKELEGKGTMIAFNTKGEEVTLSTKSKPQTSVLIVTFSEKSGNYYENNIQTQVAKLSTTYNFNINAIYVKKDYDDGWFLGDMEIYLRIKKKEGISGIWGSWYEINPLCQLSSNQTKYFTPGIILAQSTIQDFYIKIEIWEDDAWGSGDDDFVADEYYNNWRLGNGITGSWGDWLGSTSEFSYTSNGVWGSDISTFDGILGGSDYDTMWLTKN